MKLIYSLIVFLFLCISINAQTDKVSYTYDNDGNMVQRLVISVPAYVKDHYKQTNSAPVTDNLGNQKILLYPNPTKGQFQISISNLDPKAKNYYIVFSISGRRLINSELSDIMTNVDISQFPTGTYLLDIILGDKTSRWKVIKQ